MLRCVHFHFLVEVSFVLQLLLHIPWSVAFEAFREQNILCHQSFIYHILTWVFMSTGNSFLCIFYRPLYTMPYTKPNQHDKVFFMFSKGLLNISTWIITGLNNYFKTSLIDNFFFSFSPSMSNNNGLSEGIFPKHICISSLRY